MLSDREHVAVQNQNDLLETKADANIAVSFFFISMSYTNLRIARPYQPRHLVLQTAK